MKNKEKILEKIKKILHLIKIYVKMQSEKAMMKLANGSYLSKERGTEAESYPSNFHFAFPFGAGLLNYSRQAREVPL